MKSIEDYPQQSLRIAVAQAASVSGDIPENVRRAAAMIEEAARGDARLVVFPEKYLTGYVPEIIAADPERYALARGDERLEPIRQACREHGIAAIVGAPTREGGDLYISSIVIDPSGADLHVSHKAHLFHSEKEVFKSDDKRTLLKIGDWTIGLGICYDAGFPEHSRLLAQAGCHVYLVSSLFSKGMGYQESRVWFPARALDNTVYAVMANHAGKTGVWDACGGSAVWDPYGRLIVEASESEPEVIFAELEPGLLREARASEQMLADSAGLPQPEAIVAVLAGGNERP
ncbi:carbon-nitrogen hydrolase family protein [Paenibacillus sp. P22]|uniref:carbon-nitrogen hydrolase family protein n=1 Tax=Paenibacillus TaxID=44249 RepID=UPI00041AC231|nr:carbon-nitrogen hydrolase family protein [Paenibacillus sp. P22]CDN45924.1 (R)-stereoselective amidase [Paenibacillus sp. P22]